jgi:hypothetical protein
MNDLSSQLFDQAAAMNRTLARGVELGRTTSEQRIKHLEQALRAIEVAAESVASLETCRERETLIGIAILASTALHTEAS